MQIKPLTAVPLQSHINLSSDAFFSHIRTRLHISAIWEDMLSYLLWESLSSLNTLIYNSFAVYCFLACKIGNLKIVDDVHLHKKALFTFYLTIYFFQSCISSKTKYVVDGSAGITLSIA